MFELWLGELLEIIGPWEGYEKANDETLKFINDALNMLNRDKLLNNSYWEKL